MWRCQAREKDATVGEKKLGLEMAETLKEMITPFFLRRTKAEVKLSEKHRKSHVDEETAGRQLKQAVYVVFKSLVYKFMFWVW